jgi:hypothetical protein
MMNNFIFSFGFWTPEQRLRNEAHGWDDESSNTIGIRSENAAEAEKWGCEVAEAFYAHIYRGSAKWAGDPPNWKADNYAFWVSDPGASGDSGWPKVWIAAGEMPNLKDLE